MSKKNNLKIVAIEILEQCNLYCSFCVRNASKDLKGLLIAERFENILKKLTHFRDKPQVALTGGEPLMHKELPIMIEVIQSMNFYFSITTNGTVHRPNVLDKLKETESFKHFIVSIDSADSLIHNQIRKGKGSFEKTINFIEKLNERNLSFCINMTVNENNYETVTSTIRLAKCLGAKDISIATVKPNGRGDATLSQKQQTKIVNQIFECMDLTKDGFRVLANDVTFFLYDLKNYEAIASSGVGRSCAFGNSTLHIQTNGDILGCTSCDMILGNIFEIADAEMQTFWSNNPLLNAVRSKKKLSGICGTCKYKNFCGGCRCRAFALQGNLFGDDPYCPLVNQAKVDGGINV